MISCGEYDYIEIACLYRYQVKLTMKSGTVIACVALDTQRNEKNAECIKVDENGTNVLVVLNDIASLEVCEHNPLFKKVTFE